MALFEDSYEDFEFSNNYYNIECSGEINVDSVDRDPGPGCGIADYDTVINVDRIIHIDDETDKETDIDVDSPLGKKIAKAFKKAYVPADKYYEEAYEEAQQEAMDY